MLLEITKHDILKKASTMSKSQLDAEINKLIDMALTEDLGSEARAEAKNIATQYVHILKRRG